MRDNPNANIASDATPVKKKKVDIQGDYRDTKQIATPSGGSATTPNNVNNHQGAASTNGDNLDTGLQ